MNGEKAINSVGDNIFEKNDVTKNLSAFSIIPKNKEQKAFMDLLLDDRIKIITTIGPAGTGKTLLGLAAGFHQTEKNILRVF